MIHLVTLFSRQGKVRLCKFYNPNLAKSEKDKTKIVKEMISNVLSRTANMCCFIEWRDYIIVYKRYASLFFLFVVDKYGVDNELITLELIHRFVEVLDQYFGAVCELDIIYNFEKAHFLLDEMIMSGELMEPSRKAVVKYVHFSDQYQEDEILYQAVSETATL